MKCDWYHASPLLWDDRIWPISKCISVTSTFVLEERSKISPRGARLRRAPRSACNVGAGSWHNHFLPNDKCGFFIFFFFNFEGKVDNFISYKIKSYKRVPNYINFWTMNLYIKNKIRQNKRGILTALHMEGLLTFVLTVSDHNFWFLQHMPWFNMYRDFDRRCY